VFRNTSIWPNRTGWRHFFLNCCVPGPSGSPSFFCTIWSMGAWEHAANSTNATASQCHPMPSPTTACNREKCCESVVRRCRAKLLPCCRQVSPAPSHIHVSGLDEIYHLSLSLNTGNGVPFDTADLSSLPTDLVV
jgi:hypothetical protein